MTFIAGAYTATYDGTISLGQVADGFHLEHFVNKQLVTGDVVGQTPQDAVFQGHEVFVRFTLMELDAATVKSRLAFWPYSTTGTGDMLTGVWGNNGVIGATDVESGYVQQLKLTSTTSTPAVASPATITFPLAIIAEDVPIRMEIGPVLRDVELTMRVYPNVTTGVFFSTT